MNSHICSPNSPILLIGRWPEAKNVGLAEHEPDHGQHPIHPSLITWLFRGAPRAVIRVTRFGVPSLPGASPPPDPDPPLRPLRPIRILRRIRDLFTSSPSLSPSYKKLRNGQHRKKRVGNLFTFLFTFLHRFGGFVHLAESRGRGIGRGSARRGGIGFGGIRIRLRVSCGRSRTSSTRP